LSSNVSQEEKDKKGESMTFSLALEQLKGQFKTKRYG